MGGGLSRHRRRGGSNAPEEQRVMEASAHTESSPNPRRTAASPERSRIEPTPVEHLNIVDEVFGRELNGTRRRIGQSQPRPTDPQCGKITRPSRSSKTSPVEVRKRKVTVSCGLSSFLGPQAVQGGDFFYCIPVPNNWEIASPENLRVQLFHENLSRQVPVKVISPYHSLISNTWRNQIRSGLNYIFQDPEGYGIFSHEGDMHTRLPYYEVGARFGFTHKPSLSECISMAQVSVYFNASLWQMLNAGVTRCPNLQKNIDRSRARLIEMLDAEMTDFTRLGWFLEKYSQLNPELNFNLLRDSNRVAWNFRFRTFSASGDEIVDQINTIAKLVEASISWHAAPCRLSRWGSTVLGLGRFMQARGLSSEHRIEVDGQEIAVQTVFSDPNTSSSKEFAIDVGSTEEAFAIDSNGFYHFDYATDELDVWF